MQDLFNVVTNVCNMQVEEYTENFVNESHLFIWEPIELRLIRSMAREPSIYLCKLNLFKNLNYSYSREI